MSLKLPDWFENPQINKCDSWERQARLVISLVTNRIIILLKTPQKQAGSRAVTAAAFPDSHVSTPVSKQHPATASRQPHNDPGLLSQRGLRPCTPWRDYSHAKNYAVSELTAGKSLKCSYACWHSIANWWTSLNIYLCSTFRFCSSTSSWLLFFVPFVCDTKPRLNMKHRHLSLQPAQCRLLILHVKLHSTYLRKKIVSPAVDTGIHEQIGILTVHFQKKSNPPCPDTYKHFSTVVILGICGLNKRNKHHKE